MDITWTDRYEALRMPLPDPETMCEGQCEGTGVFPVYHHSGDSLKGGCRPESETNAQLLALWQEAENENPADDGWHFIKCPDCDGSGRKSQ